MERMYLWKQVCIAASSNAPLETTVWREEESFQDINVDGCEVSSTMKNHFGIRSIFIVETVNVIYKLKEDRAIHMDLHEEVKTEDEERFIESGKEEIRLNAKNCIFRD